MTSNAPNPSPLNDAELAAIETMYGQLHQNYYVLLGVSSSAERPEIRKAYAEAMKRFHPAVFEGRDLGLYQLWLEAIYNHLTKAFLTLCNADDRRSYDVTLAGSSTQMSEEESLSRKATGTVRRPVSFAEPPPRRSVSSAEFVRVRSSPPAPMEAVATPRIVTPARPISSPPTAMEAQRSVTYQSLIRSRNESLLVARRNQVQSLLNQANTAESHNHVSETLRCLREAQRLAPDDTTLANRIAVIENAQSSVSAERACVTARMYEKQLRWDLAVDAWIRASVEQPDKVSIHLGVAGASCEGMIDLQRAAEHARKATQLAPQSADAFAMLARVFFLAGRVASARGSVETALRIEPNNEQAQQIARWLGYRV
jgi:tetratricopeptide (TPR) repeat protein